MSPVPRHSTVGPSIVTPLSPSVMKQTALLLSTTEQDGDKYAITEPDDEVSFTCSLLPPKTFSAPPADLAPRQWRNKHDLYYLAKKLGQPQTVYAPGTRLEIDGVEYETVGEALAKRLGLAVFAYAQQVLPVSQIWPLESELVDLKGTEVDGVGTVPLAVWEPPADRTGARGRYDDTEGEVPARYLDAVKGTNVALVVSGGRKYKIKSAHPHFAQPHVGLRLVSLDA